MPARIANSFIPRTARVAAYAPSTMEVPTESQLLLANVAIGLFIFVVMNWLGREVEGFGYQSPSLSATGESDRTFNAVFRIASPIVVLTIITTLFYWTGFDGWTVGIHRALFVAVGLRASWIVLAGQTTLIPWARVVAQWSIMLLLGSIAYREVLSRREVLLPDPKSLAGELWLAIVGYLYILASKKFRTDPGETKRKNAFIDARYRALKRSYSDVIDRLAIEPHWRALVYAVLVIEDFNRSWLERLIEREVLFRLGRAKTLGVMQVKTTRRLTDRESIEKGVAILRDAYTPREWDDDIDPESSRYREDVVLHEMLVKYNPSGDYARSVEAVYRYLAAKEGVQIGAFLTRTPKEPSSATC